MFTNKLSTPEALRSRFEEVAVTFFGYFVVAASRNLPSSLWHSAEDVVQEALMLAWIQLQAGEFRQECSMQNWILGFIVKCAWHKARRRDTEQLTPIVSEITPARSNDHDALLTGLIQQDVLAQAVDSLSPGRQVFLENWLDDKYKGHMSGSAEKSTLHRVMRQLHDYAAKKLL